MDKSDRLAISAGFIGTWALMALADDRVFTGIILSIVAVVLYLQSFYLMNKD